MKWNLAATLAALFVAIGASAQPTVFTYQGQLISNNAPADGQFAMRFTLHDALLNGNQIGNAITNAPIGVTNGLFTTSLDFGAGVFDGSARWLQIGVRTNGDTNNFATLAPRQAVTATPYATRAATAGTAIGLTAPLNTTNLTGIVQFSNLPPNIAVLNSNANFTTPVSAPSFNGLLSGANITGKIPDSVLSSNVAFLNTNAYFVASVVGSNFFGNGVGLTNVPGRIFEVIPTATNIQALANFGYLCTNDAAPVVVTLPSTPNIRIGETIRVSASGAGGWTVAQNAGQSILMGNVANVIAQNFVARGTSALYRDVAASADGRKLVAASAAGMYTSSDYGTTWSLQASTPAAQCVASSADGTKLVAGLNSGQIQTSVNSGANWTPHNPNAAWSGVASSLDGVKLVATISGASGSIYTSVDSGTSWQQRLTPGNFTSVACSGDGTRIVATSNGGSLAVSTDSGANWTPRDTTRAWMYSACSGDGSRMLAGTSSQIYISTDYGTTWFAIGPTATTWSGVAASADGAQLAAVYGTGGIYISTDSGLTWVARNIPSATGWTSVAMASDASTVAVVGNSAQIQVSSAAATTVGVNGGLFGSRLAAIELEHVGGGVFIPISYVGTIRSK